MGAGFDDQPVRHIQVVECGPDTPPPPKFGGGVVRTQPYHLYIYYLLTGASRWVQVAGLVRTTPAPTPS